MPEIEIYTRRMCGYCSAAKALLKRKGAKFVEHDASFDQNLRAEMRKKANGASTFPQIFIGGTHVGGATDTFEAYKSGELEKLLADRGIPIGDLGGKDPYELLPNWLHKR